MEMFTHAVSRVFAYYTVAARNAVLFYRVSDIAQSVSCNSLFKTLIKRLSCGVAQPLGSRGYLTAGKGVSIVAVETFVDGSEVNAYDIALADNMVTIGYSMNDFFVYGNACSRREAVVVKKRRCRS